MIVETFGAIVGTLGFLALVIGAVMFIPIAVLKRRRPLAKKLMIGGAVAFVAGLILAPGKPDDKANAPVQATQAKSEPTPSPTPSDRSEKLATEQRFISLYHQVIAAAKPCDEATNTLGNAGKSRDMLTVYQAAKDGRDACRDATTEIGKFEAPDGLKADAKSATDKALNTCRNAYLYRQMGMEKAMQVADGDSRPSVVSEMVDNMKTGSAGTMLCVGELIGAASSAGIDIQKLK